MFLIYQEVKFNLQPNFSHFLDLAAYGGTYLQNCLKPFFHPKALLFVAQCCDLCQFCCFLCGTGLNLLFSAQKLQS